MAFFLLLENIILERLLVCVFRVYNFCKSLDSFVSFISICIRVMDQETSLSYNIDHSYTSI